MRTPIEEVEELEGMRVQDMEIREAIPEDLEDHDMMEPQEPVETIVQKDSRKRKSTWEQEERKISLSWLQSGSKG